MASSSRATFSRAKTEFVERLLYRLCNRIDANVSNTEQAVDIFSLALRPDLMRIVFSLITGAVDSPATVKSATEEFSQHVPAEHVPLIVLAAFPFYYAQCVMDNLIDKSALSNYITRLAGMVIQESVQPYVDMLAVDARSYRIHISDIDAVLGDLQPDDTGHVQMEKLKARSLLVTTLSRFIFSELCARGETIADTLNAFRTPDHTERDNILKGLDHDEILQLSDILASLQPVTRPLSVHSIFAVSVPPCFASRHERLLELMRVAERHNYSLEQSAIPAKERRLDLHLDHAARVSMVTLYKHMGIRSEDIRLAVQIGYIYSTPMPSSQTAMLRAHNKLKWVTYALKGDIRASSILPCATNPYCTFKISKCRVSDCASGFAGNDKSEVKDIEDLTLHTPITMAKEMTRLQLARAGRPV
jgi:hypothetical protein